MKRYLFFIFSITLILLFTSCDKGELELENEPKEKHSHVEFELDDEILEQSVEDLGDKLYTNEEKQQSLPQEVEAQTSYNIEEIELPSTFNEPVSAIKANDNNIIILDATVPEKQRDLYIWNSESNEITLLDINVPENHYITEVVADTEEIYWVESDQHHSIKDPNWQIKSYNITSGEITKVDSSDNYNKTLHIPHLHASDHYLAYVAGEENDEQHQYIILHDPQTKENEIVFNIDNIVEAYIAPYVNNEYVLFPDYVEDGWAILTYDIDNDKVSRENISLLTKGEFPRTFFIIDNHIMYGSNLNVLYALDKNSGVEKIITDRSSEAYVLNDELFFLEFGDVWRYHLANHTIENIIDAETNWVSNFSQNRKTLSTVSQNDETLSYYYLQLQQE